LLSDRRTEGGYAPPHAEEKGNVTWISTVKGPGVWGGGAVGGVGGGGGGGWVWGGGWGVHKEYVELEIGGAIK